MSELRMPDDLIETGGLSVMSNCDHTYEEKELDKIKNGKYFGYYAGWNFNGKVWYQDESFHCEVWQYRSYINTIPAKTPEDLMDKVSERYGAD